MTHRVNYTVGNYSKGDQSTAAIFKNHMIGKAANNRTTITSVGFFSATPNGNDLDIDIEVESPTDYNDINNGIHGGLGKAFGKGRVKKR